jgi:hypothetical protein
MRLMGEDPAFERVSLAVIGQVDRALPIAGRTYPACPAIAAIEEKSNSLTISTAKPYVY